MFMITWLFSSIPGNRYDDVPGSSGKVIDVPCTSDGNFPSLLFFQLVIDCCVLIILFFECLKAFDVIMPESRAKHWCFTLNNYTEEDEQRLRGLGNQVVYLIAGHEVGDNGTPHLQGFVSFNQRKRFTQVLNTLGQCHLSVARNVQQSIAYCRKADDDPIVVGEEPVATQGKRSDIDEFKEAVKGGMFAMDDIREHHSEVYARSPRFVLEYVNQYRPAPPIENHPLRGWQQDLGTKLARAADSRKIYFVVDVTGNCGKSWYAHYYASLNPDAQVMLPGKKADMTFCLRTDIRVLFVDAPRSKQGEFIQYDFLEDVKNGFVFSGKYESHNKRLGKVHVVVMMNEEPDMTKLSADRYEIINI